MATASKSLPRPTSVIISPQGSHCTNGEPDAMAGAKDSAVRSTDKVPALKGLLGGTDTRINNCHCYDKYFRGKVQCVCYRIPLEEVPELSPTRLPSGNNI